MSYFQRPYVIYLDIKRTIPANHRDAGKTRSERFRSEKPLCGFSRGPSEELDFPELGPGALRANQQRTFLCSPSGGMGFMNGELDLAETPYIWKEDIAKMIEGKPLGNDSAIQGQINKLLGKDSDVCKAKVYTDISCYTMAKEFEYPDYLYPFDYRKIRDLPAIEKMYEEKQYKDNTVYQRTGWDRAVETEEELQQSVVIKLKLVEEGLCGDKGAINNVAESLKKLISKYPKLRTRIMFGTDWPMTEMSVKGVARYNSAMFMMLALLTQKLGNEWDAWHQFAVINPLAFMGLIEENPDDTEETVFEVNKEKLETLKNNLIACNKTIEENNDARREKWNLETVEADNTRIEEAFKNLCLGQKNGENYIVPSSKKMRDAEGRLFITKE